MWLKDLFVSRKIAFDQTTEEILNVITPFRDAVDEFMGFHDVYKRGGKLKWEEVVFVDDADASIVILAGAVYYPVGAEVELKSGSKIKVTVDTEEYFTKMIRIGAPLAIAMGTKQEGIEYLTRTQKLAEEELEKELIVQEMDDQVYAEPEFDLTKLTQEQIEQLQKFSIIGSA